MQRSTRQISRVLALACVAGLACVASAQGTRGPSSSQDPYLVSVPGGPAIQAYSILTSGDTIGGYRFEGIPDGVGAYSNGDGTMTVLVNHELGATQGVTRAHGGTGSFVSRFVVSTTPGPNFLQVLSGRDLNDSYVTNTAGAGTLNTINRLCSGDLPSQSAFFNSATGLGTTSRILLNGEESGSNGRVFANVIDANGANTGVGYQLNAFDGLGAWENILANPSTGNNTFLVATSDGARNGVYAYLGTKSNSGSAIDRAGLTGGTTYSIEVRVDGNTIGSESRDFGFNANGSARLSADFALTPVTRNASGAVTGGNTATSFLRPEDGAWDPRPGHENDFYFVTTDRYNNAGDGTGTQVGRSRLWRTRFDDISNPTAGGTVTALLDGTEGQQMLDNICIDTLGRIILQEDVGNNQRSGRIWLYDTTTNGYGLIAQHDATRFGDYSPATLPFSQDEESSGITDASDILGPGYFFLNVQAHYSITGELVEGGQLLSLYIDPSVIPAPGAAALLGLGGILAAGRRRR